MTRIMSWLGGLGLGIGLMYLLDPKQGRQRRAFIRDQAGRSAREIGRFFGKNGRAIGDRARDVLADGKANISRPQLAAGIIGMTAAAYASRSLVARSRRSSRSRQT